MLHFTADAVTKQSCLLTAEVSLQIHPISLGGLAARTGNNKQLDVCGQTAGPDGKVLFARLSEGVDECVTSERRRLLPD